MRAIVLKTTDEQRKGRDPGDPFERDLISDVETLLAGITELDQIGKGQVKRIDSLSDQLRDTWAGHPMDTAPKDKPILAWCDHAADPYFLEEGKRLTTYGAHAEGQMHAEDGFQIVVWGGEVAESDWETGHVAAIPDWWFVAGSDWEVVANPVRWWKLPPREAA